MVDNVFLISGKNRRFCNDVQLLCKKKDDYTFAKCPSIGFSFFYDRSLNLFKLCFHFMGPTVWSYITSIGTSIQLAYNYIYEYLIHVNIYYLPTVNIMLFARLIA